MFKTFLRKMTYSTIDFTIFQDNYDKCSLELSKTKEMEIKLKVNFSFFLNLTKDNPTFYFFQDDLERTQYDLEMIRERYEKSQVNYNIIRG